MPSAARASSPRSILSSLLLAASVIVGLLAVSSTPASADVDTVTTLSHPNPGWAATILSVSCPSTTFCLSVGSSRATSNATSADIYLSTWNGSAWSSVPSTGFPVGYYPNQVSCATSTFCAITGPAFNFPETAHLLVWNGSTVSSVALPASVKRLNSVACPTTQFCMAVGMSTDTPARSLALKWDGSTWSQESGSVFASDFDQEMKDIDCASTGRCVVVTRKNINGSGGSTAEVLERTAVAGTWSVPTGRTDGFTELTNIDCQSGDLGICSAKGVQSNGSGGVLVYDLGSQNSRWTDFAGPIVPSGMMSNGVTTIDLSCVSSTQCVLVGTFFTNPPERESLVMAWNGSAWTRLTSESIGRSQIIALSCPTVSQCMGVGNGIIPPVSSTAVMPEPEEIGPMVHDANPQQDVPMAWFIRDAALVSAPGATTEAPTTTAAPTTVATPQPVFVAPTVAPTTLAPTTTPSRTEPPATTVPAPALSVVRELPVAATPIVANPTLAVGGEVAVTFGGFTPFEFVQLIVASTPQVIGSGYADAQGVVTISGNLPTGLASGSHTLAVYAPESGVGFSQPIRVTAPRLPVTGSDDPTSLYVIALTLLVGGLLIRRVRVIARP